MAGNVSATSGSSSIWQSTKESLCVAAGMGFCSGSHQEAGTGGKNRPARAFSNSINSGCMNS